MNILSWKDHRVQVLKDIIAGTPAAMEDATHSMQTSGEHQMQMEDIQQSFIIGTTFLLLSCNPVKLVN